MSRTVYREWWQSQLFVPVWVEKYAGTARLYVASYQGYSYRWLFPLSALSSLFVCAYIALQISWMAWAIAIKRTLAVRLYWLGQLDILEGGILSGHTTFNLNGSSIPTISEPLCCSFRSCHARLTEGRCSNFILHDRGFGLNGPRQVQEHIQHAYWATYIQRHN